MATTIQISDKVWKRLISLKERGESFEDVIIRLLNLDKVKIR